MAASGKGRTLGSQREIGLNGKRQKNGDGDNKDQVKYYYYRSDILQVPSAEVEEWIVSNNLAIPSPYSTNFHCR